MRSSRRERRDRRRQQESNAWRLRELELVVVDTEALPDQVAEFLSASRELIQAFWDQWLNRPIEQYVACDFEYVWHGLQALHRTGLAPGKNFVEWGCGFGVVSGLAWLSGFSAVGIEAESFLVDEGRKLLKRHRIEAELWHGNFLPTHAESIADLQADHPCLHHPVASAYEENDGELSDFAVVFAYPWPGEEHFQREVFLNYAAEGTLLFMFRGPYQIELHRKEAALG
jgi:hypothetical protein